MRRFLTIRPNRSGCVPRGLNGLQSLGVLLAQLLDFATTVVGLRLGAVEQNGPMARLVEAHGTDALLGVKLTAAVFLMWVVYRRPIAAWLVSLIYYAVALWNLSVIYRMLDIATVTLP